MRLIDADELEKYVIEKYSEGEQLAIDISDAPTIEAVPMSVIEDIWSEIQVFHMETVLCGQKESAEAIATCMSIFHKHISGKEKNEISN